jgi:hypothetical protein
MSVSKINEVTPVTLCADSAARVVQKGTSARFRKWCLQDVVRLHRAMNALERKLANGLDH